MVTTAAPTPRQPSTLNELFQRIFDEPDSQAREWLIERVLVEHHTVFTHLARQLNVRFSIDKDWHDDVRQIVRTEAWRYLSAPLKDGFEVNATIPCIRRAARAEVQRMRQSSAYTGISGAVSARRRQSAIAKHRMDLIRTLGYDPEDQEVIDSYNTQIIERRSEEKARTQGALVSQDDLHPPLLTELEEATTLGSEQPGMEDVEVREVVAEIVRRCWGTHQQLGQVAQVAFAASFEDSPGDCVWSAPQLAKQVKMPMHQVTGLLQRVRSVAAQVVQEWGIVQPAM